MAIKKLNIDFDLNVITPMTTEDNKRLSELRLLWVKRTFREKDEMDSLIFKNKANIEKDLIDDGKFPELDFEHNISARKSWAVYILEKEKAENDTTEKQIRWGVAKDVIVF